MKRWFWLAGMTAAIAAWAQTGAPTPAGAPPSTNAPADMAPGTGAARGFIVPEYDETGQLRWKMYGDTARVLLTGGRIEVRVMKLEIYRNNAVDMTMRASTCLFDRTAKMASSDDAVELVATNMTVTGKGFEWIAGDNLVKIHNDVTVTMLNRMGPTFLLTKPQSK